MSRQRCSGDNHYECKSTSFTNPFSGETDDGWHSGTFECTSCGAGHYGRHAPDVCGFTICNTCGQRYFPSGPCDCDHNEILGEDY